MGTIATAPNYIEELTPASDYRLGLASVHKIGRFYCDDHGEPESALRQAPNDQHKIGAHVRCPLAKGDRTAYDLDIEVTGESKHVAAQDGWTYQRIAIKPSHATYICNRYLTGQIDKLHGFIERNWQGRYTLEDIYLSVRCKFHRNVDLVRATLEEPEAIDYSSVVLEIYFRRRAVKNDGHSLLTKAMYCEKLYSYGLRDFFGLLDYKIERSRKRDNVARVEALSQLRERMWKHARDFPFPEDRLQLSSAEARDYRRAWCREYLPF